MGLAPWQDFQLGNQAWMDVVTDKTRQLLFEIEWLVHPAYIASTIFHPDEKRSSGRVGEGYDGAQDPRRRGEVTLELKLLAFLMAEYVFEIHSSEVYSEVAEAARLQS